METVLIVDDEALIRWSVAESLEAAGFGVIEAGTAHEALAQVDRRVDDISVAVLDLKLPDSNDLGLLRRIRQVSPRCQIILMTAHGTPEILDEAREAGAFSAISKPFDMTRIVRLVRDARSFRP